MLFAWYLLVGYFSHATFIRFICYIRLRTFASICFKIFTWKHCPLFISHCCPLFLPTVYWTVSTVHCHCPLVTVHCPLSIAHCPLPTVHCPLFTAHCPLPTDHCKLPTVYCSLPATRCLLPTVYCPLSTATVHCPVPTVHYLLAALTESVSDECKSKLFLTNCRLAKSC